jgi:hypothetical protein
VAALAGTGAIAGVAGCLSAGEDDQEADGGSGDGGSGDGSSDDGSSGDGSSAVDDGTSDEDAAATGPGSGERIDDISCAEFASTEPRAYGSGDTPFVFEFAHPDTWIESGSSPDRRSDRYTVITRSEIIEGRYQTFLTVGQFFDPIAPDDLEQAVSTEVEARSGSEEFEVLRTLAYAGETIDVYSTPGYPEGLTSVFWLPHETADGRRYFRTVFRFSYSSSFVAAVEDGDVDIHCESLFDDLADLVFPTVEPNPETTIASEL